MCYSLERYEDENRYSVVSAPEKQDRSKAIGKNTGVIK